MPVDKHWILDENGKHIDDYAMAHVDFVTFLDVIHDNQKIYNLTVNYFGILVKIDGVNETYSLQHPKGKIKILVEKFEDRWKMIITSSSDHVNLAVNELQLLKEHYSFRSVLRRGGEEYEKLRNQLPKSER